MAKSTVREDMLHKNTRGSAFQGLYKIILGPPVVPFSPPFLGEGSPTKLDYRNKIG